MNKKNFIIIIFIFLFISTAQARIFIIDNSSVSKLTKICKEASGGDVIYFHNGIYNIHFPIIKCKGNSKAYITIAPYPGDEVTIRSNWIIKGNYLLIKGLNFKGYAEKIKYKNVISSWWNPPKKYKITGLLIKGHHITIKNNAIGCYPGAGIKVTGHSDYIKIYHNIIYNNAWWSTGGTGGLVVKNIIQFDGTNKRKIDISNNLIFSNESRIISHVFQKGFVKLVIDEGESILIQQRDDVVKKGAKKGLYYGRYLIKYNLILFNGKGASLNKADNIDFIANTLYANGTTATNPNATGIRGNHTNNDTFMDNTIGCIRGGKAFSIQGKRNIFKNNYVNCVQTPPIKGVYRINKLFRNPEKLDFYNILFKDRANKLLKSFNNMLKNFNIKIKPTNYKVNLNDEIKKIIATIPKNKNTKIYYNKNKIEIFNIDRKEIKYMPKNLILELPKKHKAIYNN
ncbi:hypothetical protein LNAT_P1579 [Lebetimonas natsushimae]|uniref:Right handed beta helix domain-containing protein n=1 Tax=Lebetimonas natsushimae TaxID=1936991 RepID=A0A292YHE0_9BACT|nr:hypothetical protein [Lebetimonas natsushimae]GAX88283.1 hypothetical protein LNAT_P1579 [Lebetimonas natsushimae]